MPDSIGSITVPEIAPSGVFPILPEYPLAMSRDWQVAVHQFGSGNAKVEQRYLLGTGVRRWTVQRSRLRESERIALRDFWEARSGGYQPFTFNVPNDDGSGTTPVTVRFSEDPLSWEMLGAVISSTGVTLIEVPTESPTYTLNSTVERFPSSTLNTALLSQAQEIIPLIYVKVKAPGYPDNIYLSDRRCIIGAQLYQARLLSFSGISQAMNGESDLASFTFGNADRVMRDLVNSVDLWRASVEFALFHVGTGIKLNLWKGEVTDWSGVTSPEFSVSAADGIYELTLPYPTRKCGRSCWKDLGDGTNCTWTEGTHGRDLVHFPSASATTCDKGYDTPNGCLAHKNKPQFGAVIIKPQGVLIKDNSTGVWGFGRSNLTSTSIVNDSIYGQTIPEIWTDSSMPVNCKIAAGRDESDFYSALGIIGEGPLSGIDSDPLKHTLDGQSCHGPGALGLRYSTGDDPAQPQDRFSLSQVGDQTNGDWRKVFDGGNTYDDNYSAGTAFLEIRRSDPKGLQLSRPTEHSMVASVYGGLTGWVWGDDLVTRLAAPHLISPPWIAINSLLRARGLKNAAASEQVKYFDVEAAHGVASICNDVVPKLVGSGTEVQFRFRGVVQDEKPLRDWIQEFLTNALCFYTFKFGKLKLGIRINSSTVEAFTVGNIIFNSLELTPIRPAFNHLTANFADEEFDYQANTVALYDVDHAKLIGGSTAPLYLKSQLNLSGTFSKSQALRICTVRLREELGGINATEWRKARNIRYKTTVLALNVESGTVCSLAQDDMPDGLGEFRVMRWRLNPDYSIDIEGRTTTDSMYDVAIGPKPADVTADPPPPEPGVLPLQPWFPLRIGVVGDALYQDNEFQMLLGQEYEHLSDGTALCMLRIEGTPPTNDPFPGRPEINSISTSPTGGYLLGDRYIFAALVGVNSYGVRSNLSRVFGIYIPPGSSTNKVTLSGITWPPGTVSWRGFLSFDQSILSSTVDNPFIGLPPTLDLLYTTGRCEGPPNKDASHLRFRVKRSLRAGIMEMDCGIVSAGFENGRIDLIDSTFTPGELVGRVVSIIGRRDFPIESVNRVVVANDVNFIELGEGNQIPFRQGDWIVFRAQATTYSATTIGDSGFVNYQNPEGLEVDSMRGSVARIAFGMGAGQERVILSNTATVLTVSPPFDIVPDSTSIFVIESPGWIYDMQSTPTLNHGNEGSQSWSMPVDNYLGQTLTVFPTCVYRGGRENDARVSPWREVHVFGSPGNIGGPDGPGMISDGGVII